MTLSNLPCPPEGFTIVLRGKIKPGDKLWNPEEKKWGFSTTQEKDVLGVNVKDYYAVARKSDRILPEDVLSDDDAMLHAAMKKAVEIGVMPKHSDDESYLKNWAKMSEIISAARSAI